MSFPEQPFGFVAGRWVRSIGDTPEDPDRAPDYVPVETGTVFFTPQVTHRVAPDNTGWAGIIKERIPARVGERGQLIDAEGHDHLALATGVYSVSYDFGSGKSWPSHYIEVKPEHTADAPLWLPPIAPPPEGPRIENRVVTIPADGEDGQVLVWDGAGFSWMDVPEGPEGPAGEVTTAELTAALAGKVTGTGMTLRHDTRFGERILLDHPGGTLMLYGDTGWRVISSWDESGTVTGAPLPSGLIPTEGEYGKITIRRIMDKVTVSITGVTVTLGDVTVPIPWGFQPATVENIPRQTVATSNTTFGVMFAQNVGLFLRMNGAVINSVTGVGITFDSTQSWPVTLPGTPA